MKKKELCTSLPTRFTTYRNKNGTHVPKTPQNWKYCHTKNLLPVEKFRQTT